MSRQLRDAGRDRVLRDRDDSGGRLGDVALLRILVEHAVVCRVLRPPKVHDEVTQMPKRDDRTRGDNLKRDLHARGPCATLEEMAVRERLQRALTKAMRARDDDAVRALRSALSRVDNFAAVEAPVVDGTTLAIEHSPQLGSAEQPRRALTEEQQLNLVRAEVDERREQAALHDATGDETAAAGLRAGADVLDMILRT